MGIEKFGYSSFTGESKVGDFVDYLEKGKVMGTKCKKCGKEYFPPRADCYACLSQDMEWIEIPSEGELLTYTVCMYAPAGFEKDVPYTLAILKLENGMKIFGRISKSLKPEDLKIGMKMKVEPVKLPEGRVAYEFVKA